MHSKLYAAIVAAGALGAAADASGQTLYKLIDKNGKVTYSEKPPKDYDGKVIRLDIDPKANTATLPKGSTLAEPAEGARRPPASEEQAAATRQRLDAARKALEDARTNPAPGEVTRMGNVGGGTRLQPSEDYQKRLEKLERDVKDAEADLQKAERAR